MYNVLAELVLVNFWHACLSVYLPKYYCSSVSPIIIYSVCIILIFEPPHDKTNKMACAPSKDSNQPGHPPSLIRILTVRMKKAWVLSYPLSAQWRLWSDWADAQADLSLRWVQSFCWFSHEVAHFLSNFPCQNFLELVGEQNCYFHTNSSVGLKYVFNYQKLDQTNELEHDKTYKMTCAPSKVSDQPGNLPNLIGIFTFVWILSY